MNSPGRLLVIGLLLALGAYLSWNRRDPENAAQRDRAADQRQAQDQPSSKSDRPAGGNKTTRTPPGQADPHPGDAPTKASEIDDSSRGKVDARLIRDVTIRNQSGKIVFRGDVDLGPTLERIARGERLDFPHDGAVFQNRERRLPARRSGFYHEYVHPTPSQSGPGAQRLVLGDDGSVYYSSDHYRTFRRIE